MLPLKQELIIAALQQGTGAVIHSAVGGNGLLSGIRLWFGDLDEKHGPVAELRPYGLYGYRIILSFGAFSGEVLHQIHYALLEDVQLARALIESISKDAGVSIPGQNLADWTVEDGAFMMVATVRYPERIRDDAALVATCNEVIVPMMAAMAELIGYDVIEEPQLQHPYAIEGALSQVIVNRRERNPRNRLLCIRIHGEKCAVCGMEPRRKYGDAGGIIEVHHLEPVSHLVFPRTYDPRKDLIPLCPNCHRAAHTRRPVPFTPTELTALIGNPIG